MSQLPSRKATSHRSGAGTYKLSLATTPKAVSYKPVNAGTWYQTTKNGVTKKVYVVEVKKDEVVLKDDPSHQHSHSISRAKFDKFYVAV